LLLNHTINEQYVGLYFIDKTAINSKAKLTLYLKHVLAFSVHNVKCVINYPTTLIVSIN